MTEIWQLIVHCANGTKYELLGHVRDVFQHEMNEWMEYERPDDPDDVPEFLQDDEEGRRVRVVQGYGAFKLNCHDCQQGGERLFPATLAYRFIDVVGMFIVRIT